MVIRLRVNHIFTFNCFIPECDWSPQTFSFLSNQGINLALAKPSKERSVELYWLKLILLHPMILSIWYLWWTLKVKMKIIQSVRPLPCTVYIQHASFCKYFLSTHHVLALGLVLGTEWCCRWFPGKQTLRRKLGLWQAKRLDLVMHGQSLDTAVYGNEAWPWARNTLEAGRVCPSVLEWASTQQRVDTIPSLREYKQNIRVI